MRLRIGLLVNPIAGIGGPAALKGSDLDWKAALADGWQPVAGERAQRFLAGLEDIDVVTVPGAMGINGLDALDLPARDLGETTAADTAAAAQAFRDAGVDLLCFVGGDGTATDVAQAIGTSIPCLGIPGGVKITSPVFAHDPDEAAWLVNHLVPGFGTIDKDVTDLDESAYRDGRLDVRLTGSLRVPESPLVQASKVPTTGDTPLEGIVEQVMRDWDPDALHLIGAGSVCMALKKQFWGDATLLGVDAAHGERLVETDLDARRLATLVAEHEGPVHLWISLIGGQGMLLGRGTQMLTPILSAIGWDRLHCVAPAEKMMGLRALHVDSGDADFDAAAPKYLRVVVGYNQTRMMRLAHGAPDENA